MRRGYVQYPGEVYRYGRPNEVKVGGAADGEILSEDTNPQYNKLVISVMLGCV